MQNGLQGCGITIAHQLACSQLAETLFQASQCYSKASLETFLIAWRENLREELTSDRHNLLSRKHPWIANNITNGFPSIDTLFLNAKPITTLTETGHGPDTSHWSPRQPDLSCIALLSERLFGWGMEGKIVKCFCDNVWPGVVIQYLIQVCTDSCTLDWAHSHPGQENKQQTSGSLQPSQCASHPMHESRSWWPLDRFKCVGLQHWHQDRVAPASNPLISWCQHS